MEDIHFRGEHQYKIYFRNKTKLIYCGILYASLALESILLCVISLIDFHVC